MCVCVCLKNKSNIYLKFEIRYRNGQNEKFKFEASWKSEIFSNKGKKFYLYKWSSQLKREREYPNT
jgi:hypothetical protein